MFFPGYRWFDGWVTVLLGLGSYKDHQVVILRDWNIKNKIYVHVTRVDHNNSKVISVFGPKGN